MGEAPNLLVLFFKQRLNITDGQYKSSVKVKPKHLKLPLLTSFRKSFKACLLGMKRWDNLWTLYIFSNMAFVIIVKPICVIIFIQIIDCEVLYIASMTLLIEFKAEFWSLSSVVAILEVLIQLRLQMPQLEANRWSGRVPSVTMLMATLGPSVGPISHALNQVK